jgi:hypothetical protein
MKRILHFSLLALTALLVAGTQVHAENIKWTYDWDRKTPAVFSDDGTGAITFTNEPTRNATNGTYTVATNLKVISSADSDHLEHFNKNGAYTLTLTITDHDSGKSATLSFSAKLGGTFGAGESNITSTTPLSTKTGTPVQSVTLGKHTYTVSFYSFSPPGPTQATNLGSITFRVDVGDAHIQGNPEPTAMLLSMLGASFVGGVSWRKRRRSTPALD